MVPSHSSLAEDRETSSTGITSRLNSSCDLFLEATSESCLFGDISFRGIVIVNRAVCLGQFWPLGFL